MGSRIAAVSVRTGCAMTVFTRGAMVFLAVRRGGALPRPQATARVAPTERVVGRAALSPPPGSAPHLRRREAIPHLRI